MFAVLIGYVDVSHTLSLLALVLYGLGFVLIGGSWLIQAIRKFWRTHRAGARFVTVALFFAAVAFGGVVLHAAVKKPKPTIVVIPCDPGCQACRDAGWPDSICVWLRKLPPSAQRLAYRR